MKRILFACVIVLATSSAADAGPLRNLACRVKNHDGPVARAVRHNVAAKPARTFAGAVIEAPAKIVEARPLATWFGKMTCQNCK